MQDKEEGSGGNSKDSLDLVANKILAKRRQKALSVIREEGAPTHSTVCCDSVRARGVPFALRLLLAVSLITESAKI